MADIWQSPPQSFIRAPLAAVAYPAKPVEVMNHILYWSLMHVGRSISLTAVEADYTGEPDLLREVKKKAARPVEEIPTENPGRSGILVGGGGVECEPWRRWAGTCGACIR